MGNALGEMTGVSKEKENMKPFFQTFLGSALSAQIIPEYAADGMADACLSVFVVDADVVEGHCAFDTCVVVRLIDIK